MLKKIQDFQHLDASIQKLPRRETPLKLQLQKP